MPAAPMYLQLTGQPPYFQRTSPLHQIQLSKYYSSPHNATPPMPSSALPPTPSSAPMCLPKGRKIVLQFFPALRLINKTFLLVTLY